MNQKNSNEITIKIKSKPNELYKILEEKGYKYKKIHNGRHIFHTKRNKIRKEQCKKNPIKSSTSKRHQGPNIKQKNKTNNIQNQKL